MDSMHDTTDRMLPYSWAICYAPLRCAACMHAASSALLVQRTPSYPTSDLIRCISPCDSHSCSSDYAIVSLSGMPSLPCRLPCLQRLSASIPPRRSRVSTPQRPEAVCRHAHLRVSLVNYARAVWAAESSSVATVSLSAASRRLAFSCLALEHHSICAST
jgi:hypothetical protein